MILILSKGAVAVLATAPADAPAIACSVSSSPWLFFTATAAGAGGEGSTAATGSGDIGSAGLTPSLSLGVPPFEEAMASRRADGESLQDKIPEATLHYQNLRAESFCGKKQDGLHTSLPDGHLNSAKSQ